MARPIAETPVLKGHDARAFEKALQAAAKTKISSKELERIKANHAIMKALELK